MCTTLQIVSITEHISTVELPVHPIFQSYNLLFYVCVAVSVWFCSVLGMCVCVAFICLQVPVFKFVLHLIMLTCVNSLI